MLKSLVRSSLLVLTAALAVPATAPAAPLNADRYAKIDAVLTTQLVLDERDAGKKELAAASQACQTLGDTDRLLAPLKLQCTAGIQVALTTVAIVDCKTPRSCARAGTALDKALSGLISSTRAVNSVVAKVVPDARCRRFLFTGAGELRDAERLRAALRTLATADSPADVRRALRTINRIEGDGGSSSAAGDRRTFRAACR